MCYRFSARLAFLAVLCLLLTSPAFGQAGRSEINGTIFDQAKAVLPGASITITDENNGTTRTAVTSTEGRFVVPTLRPGTYTVKAELAGFQTAIRTGLVVAVGQELTLDLVLPVGGLTEEVSVTGEAPLVEVTTSRIGSNISSTEIDTLPSAGRNQFSLMQLVPGLTPSLQVGSFEGGQYNANGRETAANLFLVDGAYDNDDRRGGSQGTQARVTLDTMSEYQVLTHQYTAEFGGASGVVVNTVTRSGTNRMSGRSFFYYQNDDLNATNYFVEQEGGENPESGSKVFGASAGGPIIKNKAFWFANVERNLVNQAANLIFPVDAAPLATSYSDTTDFTGLNTFIRGDYQLTGNQHLSFRWVRETVLTEKDGLEGNQSTPDNFTYENDSGDQVYSFAWTSVIGGMATNEFRVGHVRENLLQGPRLLFDDNWKFIGLNGREQFDVGSMNQHEDFNAGPRDNYNQDLIRSFSIDDSFTYVRQGWGGDHTFKGGLGWSRNAALPQSVGAQSIGRFIFPTNTAFNPADARTYPWRFQIRLGQIDFEQKDWRANFYVQDKWQLNKQVTLNLGLRYDYQDLTKTKNALAPRVGVAYDPTGSGRTLIRGGIGKFYELQRLNILGTLVTSAVISPAIIFDTGQVGSPAATGAIPIDPFNSGCLSSPVGSNGLANIGPACRAYLTALRNQVNAGGNPNFEPTIDGDRELGYLWGYSFGVRQQIARDYAVSVDYVGNQGRNQTALIDINEGAPGANGRVTRLGVSGFDPTGELIPDSARSTTFRRVLQYQTLDAMDTDYNALELSLEKRHANRWSGRVSYTLAYANDVGAGVGARVSNDLDPRMDYGRSSFDNRHAFAASANADIWRGLGGGVVFRYYSGYPINETVGSDVNGDADNTGQAADRPVAGVHDLTRPILSALDANGRAIRNGIQGEDRMLLDSRFQYLLRMSRYEAGLFLEVYNLTNRVNFGDPTGNRNSSNFMVPVVAGEPRTMQLGVRFMF
jgi:hypothetical protein